MGMTYAFAGDYEKSYKQFQRTIEMDPTFSLAHLYLSGLLQYMGEFNESIQELQKSRLWSGTDPDEATREAADMVRVFNEEGEKGFWQRNHDKSCPASWPRNMRCWAKRTKPLSG